jgi:hypothetical protein
VILIMEGGLTMRERFSDRRQGSRDLEATGQEACRVYLSFRFDLERQSSLVSEAHFCELSFDAFADRI